MLESIATIIILQQENFVYSCSYRDYEDLPECLTEQLRLYEEKLFSDEEQIAMPGGVDINSHDDLFRALLEKVCMQSIITMNARRLLGKINASCMQLFQYNCFLVTCCKRTLWLLYLYLVTGLCNCNLQQYVAGGHGDLVVTLYACSSSYTAHLNYTRLIITKQYTQCDKHAQHTLITILI